MKYWLIILSVLIVFVLAVTLGAHNDQIVTFNYLIAKDEFRVSTLLACLFGAGFLLGWGICGAFYLRARFALRHAQRKLKKQQLRLDELTAKPVPSWFSAKED